MCTAITFSSKDFYFGRTLDHEQTYGEAVVISNPLLKEDFRYLMKQRGGMLAKGRLLGVQFGALMEDGLYFELGAHAVKLADRIRETFDKMGVPYLVPGTTNQIFPILPDELLEELGRNFMYTDMERIDETHRAVRFCTSWASTEENVDALCRELVRLGAR